MEIDPVERARKKIDAAIAENESRDDRADAAIWAATGLNAGFGIVPFGVNLWMFLGVVTAMVVALGAIYGHHLTREGAAKIIKHIVSAVGMMTVTLTLGIKFFAEVLKGTGVITMGGTTFVGMALDAVLCGAATYAIGYATKEYFERGQAMTKGEIRAEFKRAYKEGAAKIKEQRNGTA